MRTPQLDLKIKELVTKGAKRVAVIKNNATIMGEIYSRKTLPFKEMQVEEYGYLWDQKYGNIPGIIKTKWSGMASTHGYYWNPVTGIP